MSIYLTLERELLRRAGILATSVRKKKKKKIDELRIPDDVDRSRQLRRKNFSVAKKRGSDIPNLLPSFLSLRFSGFSTAAGDGNRARIYIFERLLFHSRGSRRKGFLPLL